VNSAGLIACSQLSGRLVGRLGPAALLRRGLFGLVVGAIGTLITTVAHFGFVPLLIALFVMLCSVGFVFPNATAVSLADQEGALGSASALLGMGQFGTGAVVAPLVGVAGSHNPVPMGVLIGICGTAALAVNLVFSRPSDRTSIRWRRSRPRQMS
jgi:MFS transporter, DHA1 family, multidrug resistance protein